MSFRRTAAGAAAAAAVGSLFLVSTAEGRYGATVPVVYAAEAEVAGKESSSAPAPSNEGASAADGVYAGSVWLRQGGFWVSAGGDVLRCIFFFFFYFFFFFSFRFLGARGVEAQLGARVLHSKRKVQGGDPGTEFGLVRRCVYCAPLPTSGPPRTPAFALFFLCQTRSCF